MNCKETTKKFGFGGVWDNNSVVIHSNYHHKHSEWEGQFNCKHAVKIDSTHPRWNTIYKSGDGDSQYIIPRIIVAENEGGYNSTGVCLDCMVEIAATLDRDKEEKEVSRD